MAALTLVQKHIWQRDMSDLLDKLSGLIFAGHLTGQHLISLVNYLLLAGEPSDAKVFVQQLAQRVPQYGDKLMTIAEQLKQIGVEWGLQKGLEQGLKKGVKKGVKKGLKKGLKKGIRLGESRGRKAEAQNIARAMLQQGFDNLAVAQLTGLSNRELTQLQP